MCGCVLNLCGFIKVITKAFTCSSEKRPSNCDIQAGNFQNKMSF